MPAALTLEEAQTAFAAVAARADEIAFRVLAEGCECRAQLMIEHLQALGIEPGRAWALAVDRLLSFRISGSPSQLFKWNNHVAPTVAVEGVEHGLLVIDPSTQAGPVTLVEWAAAIGARTIEVSNRGLSQAEILSRQTGRALLGQGLDAILFHLRLGEPPVPEVGGSGFRLAVDPPGGPSAFARAKMRRLLGR